MVTLLDDNETVTRKKQPFHKWKKKIPKEEIHILCFSFLFEEIILKHEKELNMTKVF